MYLQDINLRKFNFKRKGIFNSFSFFIIDVILIYSSLFTIFILGQSKVIVTLGNSCSFLFIEYDLTPGIFSPLKTKYSGHSSLVPKDKISKVFDKISL